MAPYFKGFTLEGAGLHQGRKQKGRETAHIMAARKQKDRIKITVFYLLPFTLPALLSYWLLLSHPGQGSSLSLVLSGTVLANTPRNSPYTGISHAIRLTGLMISVFALLQEYYMVYISSFPTSLILVYPEPVER